MHHETIKYANHFPSKLLADFDRKRFPTEHVDDRQRAEALPVDRLVRHEVDVPVFVRSFRYEAFATRHDHLATPRNLADQLQALLRVKSIHLRRPQLPALPQHVNI